MQIKDIKPSNFLFYRTRTSVDQLNQFMRVGQQLYKEAVKLELPITGPVQWQYYDFKAEPGTQFDFEVALPVAHIPAEYDGEFHVKRTGKYRCVSEIHEGSWYDIPATYQKIHEYMAKNELRPTSSSREIYIKFNFEDPTDNVTEIQLGIE